MAFVPVPEAVQVRLKFVMGSAEQMVNVLHYHNVDDAPINASSTEELSDLIAAAYASSDYIEWIDPSTVLTEIAVKDISVADRLTFQKSYAHPGTAGDPAALPFSVALCASLKTSVGSRGGRGRFFGGGFGNGAPDTVTPGICRSGVSDDLKAFLESISDLNLSIDFGEANFVLGVASREAHVGGDPEAAPVAPVIRKVEQIVVNRRWDTQRRRSNKITA